MAEFNYGINIPQPNTGMFGGNLIQGLSAIEGLRAAQAQREQAAALAPYQLEHAQLGIQAQKQQMAQSAAAAGRAAELYNLQRQAAVANQERQTQVANALAQYGQDPNADLSSLSSILPMLDKSTLDAVQKVETIKIGDAYSKLDPNNPEPEAIRKLAARSLMLDTEQGKRFDALLASLPDPAKQGLVDTALKVSNAGISGNTDVALDMMKEQAAAYSNSKDARYQQMGKLLNDSIKTLGDNPTPSAFALMGQTLMLRAGDEKATKQFNDILTSFYKEASPQALAEKEAGTAAKMAQANREQATGNLPVAAMKIVETATSQYEKMQELSNKASMLSEKLSQIERPTGKLGEIKNLFSVLLGNEKDVASFTRELKQLGNQQALTEWASVAKGSMSDRDVRVALSTVPSPFGSKEILQDYLTSLSNASKRAAEFQGAKADWVSKFAGNGAAKFDTEIGGVSVTKGQTLREFQDKLAKNILGKQDSTEVGTDPFSRAAEYLRKGGK